MAHRVCWEKMPLAAGERRSMLVNSTKAGVPSPLTHSAWHPGVGSNLQKHSRQPSSRCASPHDPLSTRSQSDLYKPWIIYHCPSQRPSMPCLHPTKFQPPATACGALHAGTLPPSPASSHSLTTPFSLDLLHGGSPFFVLLPVSRTARCTLAPFCHWVWGQMLPPHSGFL